VSEGGVPPSKVHSQDVGLFVDWSVKLTVPPTTTVVGFPTKSATGATSPVLFGSNPGHVSAPVLFGSNHGFSWSAAVGTI